MPNNTDHTHKLPKRNPVSPSKCVVAVDTSGETSFSSSFLPATQTLRTSVLRPEEGKISLFRSFFRRVRTALQPIADVSPIGALSLMVPWLHTAHTTHTLQGRSNVKQRERGSQCCPPGGGPPFKNPVELRRLRLRIHGVYTIQCSCPWPSY